MKVAQSLKIARAERNLSQRVLSDQSLVSQVTISQIENGRVEPYRSTRIKIEKIIGPIDWKKTFADGLINRKEKL